jgi:hypothetical protein
MNWITRFTDCCRRRAGARAHVAAAHVCVDNFNMAISHSLTPLEHGRRNPLLAWSFSLATHLATLLALWLLLAIAWPTPESLPRERRAFIVLRPRNVAASVSNSPEPVRQDDVALNVATPPPEGFDASLTPSSDSVLPANAIPHQAGSSISLPRLPDELGAGSQVVTTLRPAVGPNGRPKLPFAMIDEAAVLAEDAKIPRKVVPTGPTAVLDMFGAAAEGRSFVFVIDRSQSMGGDGLGGIAAVAKQFEANLAALSADQRIQVVAYNESIAYFQRRGLLPATEENQRALATYVERLAAFGPTEHEHGLLAALTLEPEVIYLFTDGGDPHLKPGQIASIRERAAESSTSVHVIHFSRDLGEIPANHFLRRLAAENGGTYVLVRP